MTYKARLALGVLYRSVKKNSRRINRKLSRAGVKPDPALVFSAAKYYSALSRLAKE
jgi:hypothetical protein